MNNLECNNGKLSFLAVKDKINEIIAYFSNYFTKTESDSRFLSKSNVIENNTKFMIGWASPTFSYIDTDDTYEDITYSSGKYLVFFTVWKNRTAGNGDDDDVTVSITEVNGGNYRQLSAISAESGVGLYRDFVTGVGIVENMSSDVITRVSIVTDSTTKFTGTIRLMFVKIFN